VEEAVNYTVGFKDAKESPVLIDDDDDGNAILNS
jgi:hypothetical protein